MNIVLWVLQVVLALHTAMGALWKFSHGAEQTMPSLKAIPPGVWHSMSVLELFCVLALVIPAVPALRRSFARLVPIAALVIVAEQLLFMVLHLTSGDGSMGPIAYWGVVAAVSAFIAYGRLKLKPL